MASIPQNEPAETIAISVETINLLVRMRAGQRQYRVRREGPSVPRLRLMESDLDKLLASLPHEGYAHELLALRAGDVEEIRAMRRLQSEALKRKDWDLREMHAAERVVDEILAGLSSPRIAHESTARPVAAGNHDEDEDARPTGWMPYKDD